PFSWPRNSPASPADMWPCPIRSVPLRDWWKDNMTAFPNRPSIWRAGSTRSSNARRRCDDDFEFYRGFMKTFKLQVVATDASSLSEEVSLVVLPGEVGEFGVMAGHMSLLSTLKPGTMRVVKGQNRELYFLAGGFVEVN